MEADEEGQDGQEPSFGALAAAAADGGLGGRRALQVELPAQLGMEPEDLQRIRCAVCDGRWSSHDRVRAGWSAAQRKAPMWRQEQGMPACWVATRYRMQSCAAV